MCYKFVHSKYLCYTTDIFATCKEALPKLPLPFQCTSYKMYKFLIVVFPWLFLINSAITHFDKI